MEDGDVNELRVRAIDLARLEADGDKELIELRPRLERDTFWWAPAWAPALALAYLRSGQADVAWEVLQAAAADGFHQPESFRLERWFGSDPRWPGLLKLMRDSVPPPKLELLDWPDPVPSLSPKLMRAAPEREALLRERLPEPKSTAWETAVGLLHWAQGSWEHTGGNHAYQADAVEILDRVGSGERFACVEFTIVLSHALNAAGIPARGVSLYGAHHHVGIGKGHRVSEAWIDELGRWVLLDGQNGAIWTDGNTDEALGVRELHQRFLAGEPRPRLVGSAKEFGEDDMDEWWSYFAGIAPTGVLVADRTFVPHFENALLMTTDRLLRDDAQAYPELGQVSIGFAGTPEAPAVTLDTIHPYAKGFEVECRGQRTVLPRTEAQWPVDLTPGEQVAEIKLVTNYGEYDAGRITYVAR
ncbi:transglutaminase domain-containing protein [Flindersiella endophytica]